MAHRMFLAGMAVVTALLCISCASQNSFSNMKPVTLPSNPSITGNNITPSINFRNGEIKNGKSSFRRVDLKGDPEKEFTAYQQLHHTPKAYIKAEDYLTRALQSMSAPSGRPITVDIIITPWLNYSPPYGRDYLFWKNLFQDMTIVGFFFSDYYDVFTQFKMDVVVTENEKVLFQKSYTASKKVEQTVHAFDVEKKFSNGLMREDAASVFQHEVEATFSKFLSDFKA